MQTMECSQHRSLDDEEQSVVSIKPKLLCISSRVSKCLCVRGSATQCVCLFHFLVAIANSYVYTLQSMLRYIGRRKC